MILKVTTTCIVNNHLASLEKYIDNISEIDNLNKKEISALINNTVRHFRNDKEEIISRHAEIFTNSFVKMSDVNIEKY